MDAFSRLLDLLAALQGGPTRTGEDLADRLGVTVRTLRRDIARLRDAGFTIDAAPGVYGGYRLAAGSRVPPLLLTDDEAIAVAIALRGTATATVEGLGDAPAAAALAKLERLLPAGVRSRVAGLRDATVSMLRTPPAQAHADTLLLLARGCRECVGVAFTYTNRAGETTDRVVEPYRLVQTSHCWYLVARDCSEFSWRTFRADRIAKPALTGQRFVHHDPPDAERLVTQAMAVAPYPHHATLDLPVSAGEASAVIPRSYGLVEPIDETASRVTIGYVHERWLVLFIAGLPWDVDVLEPDSIREALAVLGRRLAARHAGRDHGTITDVTVASR